MRVNRFGFPLLTVRDLVQQQLDLTTWCKGCDELGRTLVAEDLAALVGEQICVQDLEERLRCRRCGCRGRAEIRVMVRDNRGRVPWSGSTVLLHAVALVSRVILEQRPELDAPALAASPAVSIAPNPGISKLTTPASPTRSAVTVARSSPSSFRTSRENTVMKETQSRFQRQG